MREQAVSKAEEQFIKHLLLSGARNDGRDLLDYRKIDITYGREYGTCMASIGSTRALAQVSCSLDRPSETRPNEGKIVFKINLPPIASPSYELNRSSPFAIELNRLLERAIVKSRCVDVEELCVRSGERCWTLRVEATALNNEGNLSDTLCLAAIGALMHFRRPDVTVDGTEVTVHDPEEKEPVKLTLHHKPFTVTMGYTAEQKEGGDRKVIILDPSRQEEIVLSGAISVAINKHREICALHLSGESEIQSDQILYCTKVAAEKVSKIQEIVENAIKKDNKMRKKGILPRITCSAFSPDFGDLTNFMDILQEIEVTSKNLVQETVGVKAGEEEPSEVEQKMEINNPEPPEQNESEIKISENGSNWNETEKWFDENKKTDKSPVDKHIDQKEGENESDEEEIVNVVQSEFT